VLLEQFRWNLHQIILYRGWSVTGALAFERSNVTAENLLGDIDIISSYGTIFNDILS
jgi:hypothetical protein